MSGQPSIPAAITILVATVAAIGVVQSVEARVVQAPKVCKSFLLPATGEKRFVKAIAKLGARHAWQKRVANGAHGPSWANWSIANNRSYNCNKNGAKWQCTARARPCKV